MRRKRLYFDDHCTGAIKFLTFHGGSFACVPSYCPGILVAYDEYFFSQAMVMISANVARKRRAEVNVLDRTQKGELLLLKRIAGATLIPAIVE